MSDPAASLAQRLAARLGTIDGVLAVAVGGSVARGDDDADSDIDLGIYYDAAHRPAVDALRALAREIDDRGRPDAATDYGEWGPRIDGGAWLIVKGRRVDWLYRDVARVRQAIDDCRAGRVACDHQLGHPDGFHNQVYAAEVHHARLLHDPTRVLAALQASTTPYPAALRAAIVPKYLFDADFWLDISRKSARRADVFHVAGCLFAAAASLVQVVFALNERWWMNEKRSVAIAGALPRSPADFGQVVTDVLARPGRTSTELTASIDRLSALARAVRQLAA